VFNATFCTVGRYASEDSAQPVMNEVLTCTVTPTCAVIWR